MVDDKLFDIADARAKKLLPCTPHYSRLLYDEFALAVKSTLRDGGNEATLAALGSTVLAQTVKLFVSTAATMVQFRRPDDTIAEFTRGLLNEFERSVWEELKEIEQMVKMTGGKL